MSNAFDANVPKRKPKTRLSGILADAEQARDGRLSAVPAEADPEGLEEAHHEPLPSAPLEPAASAPREAAASAPRELAEELAALRERIAPLVQQVRAEPIEPVRSAPAREPEPEPPRRHPIREYDPEPRRTLARDPEPEPRKPVRPPLPSATDVELRSGQARVAELRARLERASGSSASRSLEPTAAAGRIRDTVAALRAQLQRASQERSELLESLQETRRDLLGAQRELEALRSERDQLRGQASQHLEVAESLLSECESLAQERDATLARIQEFRSLEAEQGALLEQLGARLAERESEATSRQRELLEAQESLTAAEGERELVQLRLDEVYAENLRLRERVGQLESDVGAAATARDALFEIQRLMDTLQP